MRNILYSLSCKISIVVPVYNTEQYLRKCLDSIINQTYNNLEIILIDDGSTDGSSTIVDEYAEADSRVIAIHKKNAGVSSARNIGIAQASGDYIGFVDSDDYVELNMFERLLSTALSCSADAVICAFAGREIKETNIKLFSGLEAIIEMNRGYYFMGQLANKLFKIDLFNDIRLDESIAILEDLLCLHYVFLNAKIIAYVNEGYYHYRDNPESALKTKLFKKSYLTRLNASYEIIAFFKKYLPNEMFWAYKTLFITDYEIVKKITNSSNKNEYMPYLNKCVKEYESNYNTIYFENYSRNERMFFYALRLGFIPYNILMKFQKIKHAVFKHKNS